jgi:peptidoglycan/LPS O-acetylase OafA/YrhL
LALAVLVVAQHFQHLLAPADRAIFSRMGFGAMAVCVFFVVSGFVVTEANAVFYAGRPVAFLQNRLLRLVPPYLAALALSVAVHAALWRGGALVLWDYPQAGAPVTWGRVGAGVLGLLPGLNPGGFEFIPFAWSLRMEMAFYAAVTAALLAAAVLGRAAIAMALAAGLAGSLAFLTQGRPGLMSCAPMFLLGVALCLAARRGGALRCAFLAACLPTAAWGFASWGQHGRPQLGLQWLVLWMLLALFWILATGRASHAWQRFDQRFGDLSYPLYLNHYVVGIALTGLVPAQNFVIYVAGLCLALGLAMVMSWLVDGHLKAVRNRLRQVEV